MDATGTENYLGSSSLKYIIALTHHFLPRNFKSEVMVPVRASGSSHCRAGQTGVCLIM